MSLMLQINNWTDLHGTAVKGHNSIVETLIVARVDINNIDSYGRRAMYWTAMDGYCTGQHVSDITAWYR